MSENSAPELNKRKNVYLDDIDITFFNNLLSAFLTTIDDGIVNDEFVENIIKEELYMNLYEFYRMAAILMNKFYRRLH